MAVIVLGHSESGDDYFIGVFDREPTDEEFAEMIREISPDEVDEDGYCWVHPITWEWDGVIKEIK